MSAAMMDQLQTPQRPPALVAFVGYLISSGMRIDPTNPDWAGGDHLLFSEGFTDVVQHAFELAGCHESHLPRAGFAALPELIASGQSIYALVESKDASRLAGLKELPRQLTVVCEETPTDSHRWDIRLIESPRLESLDICSSCHAKERDLPMWIVSPLGGNRIMEPSGTTKTHELAERMSHLGTETAFDVLAQVNRLKAEGRDILSFGLGEPDFDTPAHIREAAKNAIDKGFTHYGPSAGLPELRQAIARYIQRTRHIPCDESEVVVTPGAKPVMFDAMMALIDPGDEVIYPNPGYPIYESVIDWIGGISVPLPLLEDRNWNFTIEEVVDCLTPRTKAIVLNTPGNPCGNLLGKELLRDLAKLAVDRNLWVISDEVYSQIVFDEEFTSIVSFPGMKERTVIVDGFSKTYAMTGWRLGYGVMPPDLAVQVAKIETNIDSCTCSFTQIGGIHALEGPQHESEHMAQQFRLRGKAIADGLNNIDGVTCCQPGGAFYVFPNVTAACRRLGLKDAVQLQRALLEEAGVAVLPRTCFGRKNVGEEQEYLRLSFATSLENIQEGLRRMKRFIER